MDNINGLMADCGLRQRKRGMVESSGETVLNQGTRKNTRWVPNCMLGRELLIV